MMRTDIANHTIYITRPVITRGKVSSIYGTQVRRVFGRECLCMRQGKMKEGAEYTNTLLKQVNGRSKIKGGKVFWNVVILEPGRGSVPESKFYRKSEPVVYLPHATYTRKKTKSPGLSQLRPVKYGSQSESAKAWAEQQLFKR